MCLGISIRCWMRLFQHPDTVQCAWVHAYLYERPLLVKETIFPYLIDQATHISLQNQLWNIPKVVFIFKEIFVFVLDDPKDVPTF